MTSDRLRCFVRRLSQDTCGATIVEFAVVAPVLITMLMFLFDTGFHLYASSILGGEVNAAGRSSTLESATDVGRAEMDARVTGQIQRLVPHGELEFERTAYKSYVRAQAMAEPFVDSNDNQECDDGELFADENGNGIHDADAGVAGGGGARDVVIYTATLTYDRLFPLAGLLGWDQEVRVASSTVLRNQPFDKQAQARQGRCA